MGRQKRSPNTYQKIDTIFKRDVNNIIMPFDGLVSPELEYLRGCKFDAEEKIDGTNIRIEVQRKISGSFCVPELQEDWNDYPAEITWEVKYKGKTDNANLPKKLDDFLKETYTEEKVLAALGLKKTMSIMDDLDDLTERGWVIQEEAGSRTLINLDAVPTMYTLYGEGYGVKIQGCGGSYLKNSNAFIGFDVKVDNLYLLRENRDEIFTKLGCPIVPYIGQFTIDEAIDFVRKGFTSKIAEDPNFLAEGLVLRTPMGLKNRRGERIIFKVKTCDFVKYRAQYGTDEKVEQTPNTYIQ